MKKQKKNDIGSRMKSYERANKNFLTPGVPVILRIDGRALQTNSAVRTSASTATGETNKDVIVK